MWAAIITIAMDWNTTYMFKSIVHNNGGIGKLIGCNEDC